MRGIKMRIYKSVSGTYRAHPLMELKNIEDEHRLCARVLAKLELFNPAGSTKDRVAKAMLDDAEAKGLLSAGGTIIEPYQRQHRHRPCGDKATSRGYRVIIVMPDSMSVERRLLMTAYGAELVLTEGQKRAWPERSKKAEELKAEIPGALILGQFENPANPAAHRVTTGPEIWEDTDGKVDIFVAGVGTGGTISGVGQYLKSRNKGVKIVAVEPKTSPLLSEGHAGPHGLQGIGANFIPKALDQSVYDEIITVSDEGGVCCRQRALPRARASSPEYPLELRCTRRLSLQKRPENAGKCIVALLPDTGERISVQSHV